MGTPDGSGRTLAGRRRVKTDLKSHGIHLVLRVPDEFREQQVERLELGARLLCRNELELGRIVVVIICISMDLT
jgi:hypothetical protein